MGLFDVPAIPRKWSSNCDLAVDQYLRRTNPFLKIFHGPTNEIIGHPNRRRFPEIKKRFTINDE